MSGAVDRALGEQAARMDDTYAFQRHIYDLTRKYYLLGRDRLIRELDVPSGGSVLEIGCGTARNLVLAGRHYPQACLYGLDISEEMLKTARSKLAGTPLAGRIALARADATAFNGASLFGQKRFDRIFCSYTLSMIPDWHGTIRRAAQALSPTGSLHIVDFGQQDHLPRAFRFLLQRWLARFHVTPREDLFTVCADIASEQGLHLQMRQLYRDYARMVVLKASG